MLKERSLSANVLTIVLQTQNHIHTHTRILTVRGGGGTYFGDEIRGGRVFGLRFGFREGIDG